MKRKLFILALLMCVIAGCLALTACGSGSGTKKSKSSNNDGTYYYYDIESNEYDKTAKLVIDGKTFTMYEDNVTLAQGDVTVSGKSFIATAKVTESGMTVDVKLEGTISDGVINITKETVTAMGQAKTETVNIYYCKEGKKPTPSSSGGNEQDDEQEEGLKFSLNADGASYAVSGIGTCTDSNIVIPDTYKGLPVTRIGNSAFYGCNGIKSITIPDGVMSIGERAFAESNAIEYIYYTGKIDDWVSISGLLNIMSYGKSNKNLYIDGKLIAGNYVIPDGVTNIESGAFYGCIRLTSITIPDSVTSIGDKAFESCSGLTDVTFGSGVTNIGNASFEYCGGLTNITIPDSVTSIGSSAFFGCSGLTDVTIGSGVTIIGNSAFNRCTGLTSILIPGSVTSIENYAFEGCNNIETATYPTNAIEYIPQDSLKTVVINGGTSIDSSAFS